MYVLTSCVRAAKVQARLCISTGFCLPEHLMLRHAIGTNIPQTGPSVLDPVMTNNSTHSVI